jgi:hypothetical protein
MGFVGGVTQGNLNRIATHIVVASFTNLNVTAGYMGKSQAIVTLDGPIVNQIGTATSVVNSPEPYIMSTLVISLLRSQSLSNAWLAQIQSNATIGTVTAFPDSSTFSPIELVNCSIQDFDPGAFDGGDPTVKVTIRGVFYVNSAMWASLTGAIAAAI